MKQEMICIVCPMGCHIAVDKETLEVTGNACPRGAVYGKEELTAPKRVVTSTVRIKNAIDNRCPVKTNGSIPKELNFECMNELKKIDLISPVKRGDVVIANIFNTGVDVVVTKDM